MDDSTAMPFGAASFMLDQIAATLDHWYEIHALKLNRSVSYLNPYPSTLYPHMDDTIFTLDPHIDHVIFTSDTDFLV